MSENFAGVAVGGKRTHRDEDLDSEFEFAPEGKKNTWRDDPIAGASKPTLSSASHSATIPSKQLVVVERDKEEWRSRRYHYLAMDAYARHKALVNQYLLSTGHGIEHFKRPSDKDRNDYTVLAEEHRFLWEPGEEAQTWEERLAKTYYDKLFKEYAIADLTRYKENKIAIRWRIDKEVCDGKGQFVCGNKHCLTKEALTSWEVNFAYSERNERKNALVKLRLCPKCSKKLNYHKQCKVWGGGGSKKGKKRSKKHKKKNVSEDYHREKHSNKHHHSASRKSPSPDDSDATDDDSGPGGGEGDEDGKAASGDQTDIWKKSAEAFLEKSKEEEFDDYFKDMLL